jgi:hypothetical protein
MGSLSIVKTSVPAAAALTLLALLPGAARAASCCGGGGGGAVVVPRDNRFLLDLSLEAEEYVGQWDQDGVHRPDAPGAQPAQRRVGLAGGWRFARDWQVGLSVPWVWNDNRFSTYSRHTSSVGDTTLSVAWDLHAERSIWKILSAADLLPSVTVGAALLVPTGLSPYDAIDDQYDVTGRGFYRLDATLAVDKTFRGFSASLAAAYGVHLERSVNRFNGLFKAPYQEQLGARASASLSAGYRLFVGASGDSLTTTGAFSWLHEADRSLNGNRQRETGLFKTALAATVTWAGTDRDWSLRASWSHALRRDGWGAGFPTTDVFSVGYRHVLR